MLMTMLTQPKLAWTVLMNNDEVSFLNQVWAILSSPIALGIYAILILAAIMVLIAFVLVGECLFGTARHHISAMQAKLVVGRIHSRVDAFVVPVLHCGAFDFIYGVTVRSAVGVEIRCPPGAAYGCVGMFVYTFIHVRGITCVVSVACHNVRFLIF